MVSHMLRMQKVLGSNPSVSNFEKTNKHLFSILPISNTSSLWCVPTCVPHGPIKACCSSDGKHKSRSTEFAMLALSVGRRQRSKFESLRAFLECFPFKPPPQPLGNYHQHFLQHAYLGTVPEVETEAKYFVCGRLRNAPTVGLKPTTTRLRALRSTD